MSIATYIIQDLHAPPGIPFVFQIRDELPPFPIRQDLYQDLNGTTAIVVGVDGGIPKPPIVFRHGVGKGLNVSEAEFRETECEVGDKHGRPQNQLLHGMCSPTWQQRVGRVAASEIAEAHTFRLRARLSVYGHVNPASFMPNLYRPCGDCRQQTPRGCVPTPR